MSENQQKEYKSVSAHYSADNSSRQSVVESLGNGNKIAVFYWDRGHQDGFEKHIIYDNGIIEIVNGITNRMITRLIGRPEQLMRYSKMGFRNELNEKTRRMKNWLVPQRVLRLAAAHQRAGLNYS